MSNDDVKTGPFLHEPIVMKLASFPAGINRLGKMSGEGLYLPVAELGGRGAVDVNVNRRQGRET